MPSARPQLPERQWKRSFQMLKQRMCLYTATSWAAPIWLCYAILMGNDDDIILIGHEILGIPNFPIHTCGADVLRMVEWQSLK